MTGMAHIIVRMHPAINIMVFFISFSFFWVYLFSLYGGQMAAVAGAAHSNISAEWRTVHKTFAVVSCQFIDV